MDLSRIYTKTSRGILDGNLKAGVLTRDHARLLAMIDGRSTVRDLLQTNTRLSENHLAATLDELVAGGFIRLLKANNADDDLGFSSTIIVDEANTQAFFEAQAAAESQMRRAEDRAVLAKEQAREALLKEVSADIAAEAEVLRRQDAEQRARVSPQVQAPSSPAAPSAKPQNRKTDHPADKPDAKPASSVAQIKARSSADQSTKAAPRALEAAKQATREEAAQKERLAKETAALERRELEAKIRAEEIAQRNAEMETRLREMELAKNQAQSEVKTLSKALDKARIAAELETRVKRRLEARAREESETRARLEAEAQAKLQAEAEAKARAEAEAAAHLEAERKARIEAEERAHAEAEARAKVEAEAQAQLAAEKLAAEAARVRAEEAARRQAEAEAEAKLEIEHKARIEAEARANAEAEARAKAEAEAQALLEAEKHAAEEARMRAEAEARRQAAEEAQRLAAVEAEAKLEAERKAQREAEEKARAEAETRAKAEAEAQALLEAEKRAAEDRALRQAAAAAEAQLEAERKARAEAEKALAEAEAQALQAAEKRAAEEALARTAEEARRQAEAAAQERLQAEQQARAEAEQKAEAEAQARAQAEALAQQQAQELAQRQAEAEAQAVAAAEEAVRLEAESAKRQIEEQQRAEETLRLSEAAARALAEERQARAEADQARAQLAQSLAAERAQMEKAAQAREQDRQRAREEANVKARAEMEEALLLADAEKQREAMEEERLRAAAEVRAQAADLSFLTQRKRKPWRFEKRWIKPIAMGVVVLLLLAIGLAHVVSFNFYIPRLQQQLTQSLGQRVTIQDLHFSSYPAPHLELDGVAIGDGAGLRMAKANLFPTFSSWFADAKVLRRVELEALSFSESNLPALSLWSRQQARATPLQFEHLQLTNARFSHPLMDVFSFNAEIDVRRGRFAQARIQSTDQRFNLNFSPLGSPLGDTLRIELSAVKSVLPMEPRLPFDTLKVLAVAQAGKLTLNSIDAQLLEGYLSGTGELDWRKAWNFKADLELKQVALAAGLKHFTFETKSTGTLEAKVRIVSQADRLEKLLAAPQVQATFRVKNGEYSGIDLVRAIQAQSRGGNSGGKTHFNELSGYFQYAKARYQYRQIKLQGGVVSASGNLDIGPEQSLSGNLLADLHAQSAKQRVSFVFAGNLGAPMLKPVAATRRITPAPQVPVEPAGPAEEEQ